jgi:NOL1/NOP2/fmu family ribosome biogenesis protein
MLVDAPCSGEGLFRKDPTAMSEWSESHVALCAARQRRIVSDAWDALKDAGLLLYSTCTYSPEENEDNVRWITQHLGAEVVHIPLQAAWGVVENGYGYRFFPHRVKGEGFFISLLRKKRRTPPPNPLQRSRSPFTVHRSPPVVSAWLNGDFTFIREGDCVQALPTFAIPDLLRLKQHLRLVQAGVRTGNVKGADIVPDAALALSAALRRAAFPCEEVDRNTALRFLRRDAIAPATQTRGYCLINYKNTPLGFVKHLGARSNNLYPAAWRIRMEIW